MWELTSTASTFVTVANVGPTDDAGGPYAGVVHNLRRR